ncbi:hypothetical protein ACWDYH_37695 [Nocardia goodfellowii]
MLSTNALIIAGTALTFSARGPSRPGLAVVCTTFGTLLFVAISVVLAAMALVSSGALVSRRKWLRDWDEVYSVAGFVYAYPYYDDRFGTFEQFHDAVTNLSPEQQLRGALLELWVASSVDHHRYRMLHAAIRCLLAAIGFLLTTVALTTLLH